MIRTTIVALNQANMTGNYSVLRDLAAPSFQQANNAARLSDIFANLRQRRLDLAPILFFEPKLVRTPNLQQNGRLRLSGYFETRPEQVNFDLSFEWFANEWRLFGIAIEVGAPKAAQQTSADEAAAKAAPSGAVSKPSVQGAGSPVQPGPMPPR